MAGKEKPAEPDLAERLDRIEAKLDQVLADGKGLQTEVGALKVTLASLSEWVKRMARQAKAALA